VSTYEVTIKTDFIKIYFEVLNWIKLATEDIKLRDFVKAALNRRVLQNREYYLLPQVLKQSPRHN
jgi:hypothetical protein